ncbi:uroporphyrinogen-III synthase [Massilia forsythiae]|nr:uroporphyrinogen-III synthase [Massilia forsythiae]
MPEQDAGAAPGAAVTPPAAMGAAAAAAGGHSDAAALAGAYPGAAGADGTASAVAAPNSASEARDRHDVPVVITRPRRQAEPLARAVTALGRRPVLLPLLDIAPVDDQDGLRCVLAGLHEYALVAFVSPNAVDAAFAHIPRWPADTAIAVVGEGSRLALAQYGVDDACARIYRPRDPAHSDSEHLLQALDLDAIAGRRALVVRGDGGRELLPDALRAAGCAVDTLVAYRRAVPALDAALAAALADLLVRPNDWIVTSSEALRGLDALVRSLEGAENVAKLQQQRLIVPHARIAQTARALGFTEITLTGSGDERLLAALQSRA